ncbi:hypothetical protein PUMCH_003074 [Australozyma saopauloensis]|uniref:Kynurenine 3-monooxygenase n=1 Tax=Australozyma saopauloensis TaxID=291208 RepID=A0AAX4HBT5_9ASCO|nr:hypothetical protein PUMCH_003074 [[Candida] saopauloensis]
MSESVAVIGAGLVGCLAALAFSSKGYNVTLYELRQDPRQDVSSGKSMRSINLAVSDRGIRALKYVNEEMAERILKHVIPMTGRMIHDITGTKQESQVYGLFGESINSIDRLLLNKCLLDELDKCNIKTFFEHKLVDMGNVSTPDSPIFLEFVTKDSKREKREFDFIVGCDGAFSQSRYLMQKTMRMNYSQKYVEQQYIELYIPPASGSSSSDPKYSIDPNHLHIWPRKEFMLIALANSDGSFTSTFFSTWNLIDSIKSSQEFLDFFKKNFPDAYTMIGEAGLKHAYENQPRGALMQVALSPFVSPNNRAILIGDAAHSMVPFYGQGMNCGFEDVHVLMKLIEQNKTIEKAFSKYTDARKEDVDTICRLAYENYQNMSAKVLDPFYLLRKKIDYVFGKYCNGILFPWIPMYTMVSFRGDIRYSDAVRIEKRQSRVLQLLQYVSVGGVAIYAAAKAAQYMDRLRN